MNNKKEHFKKVVAFVSALSFLAVSNYGAVNSVAAEIISEQITKTTAFDNENNQSGTNNDELHSDNSDGGSQTTTSQPSVTETTTTTTTTTAMVAQKYQTIINVTNQNKRDDIFNKISYEISWQGYNVQKSDNSNIVISYECYDHDKEQKETTLNTYLEGFNLDDIQSDGLCHRYKCENNIIDMVVYYPVSFTKGIEWLDNHTLESEDDSVYTYNNNTYLKSGTDLSEVTFSVKFGYTLVEKSRSLQVDNKIIVADNGVYKDNTDNENNRLFEAVQNQLNINFVNTTGVEIDGVNDNKLNLTWSEIDSTRITIKTENEEDKKISINGNVLNPTHDNVWSYSVRELLSQGGIKDFSSLAKPEAEIEIAIVSVPDKIELQPKLCDNGEESNGNLTSYEVSGNKVKVPVIIKHDGYDYYLSNWSNGKSSLSRALKEVKHYYDEIEYTGSIEIKYTKVPTDEKITITKSEIINAILSGNSESFIRNDSVIALEKTPSINIDMPDITDKTILFANSRLDKIFVQTLNEVDARIKDNQEDIKFLNITSVFDTSDQDDIKAIKFSEPVYLYIDQTDPIVKFEDKDEEDETQENKWSNSKDDEGHGKYEFSFEVTDNETIDDSWSDELKEIYRNINKNDNLASISSITVGDITFDKGEEGWNTEKEIKGDNYSIKITPEFYSDENGGTVGKFNAVLTLNNPNEDFEGDINIYATDKFEHNSGEIKQSVMIDITAPAVDSISIQNLVDNLSGQKVFTSGTNLVVTAEFSDTYSGVDSVEYKYDSYTSDDGNFNIENGNDILTIEVTDKAGNKATYYYDGTGVTTKKSGAVNIVVDNTLPDTPDIVFDECDYKNEVTGQQWYGYYPEMSFNLYDADSGVKSAFIEINGNTTEVSAKTIIDALKKAGIFDEEKDKISDVLKSGELYINFKSNSVNNQQFIPCICYSGNENFEMKIFEYKDYLSLDADGRLSVKITAKDYAEKQGETSEKIVYIDNNAPTVSDTFVSEETAVRKFGTFANNPIEIKVKVSDTEINNLPVSSSGINKAVLEFAGESYVVKGEEIKDGYACFRIPHELLKDSCVSGKMKITVTDNVGHFYNVVDIKNSQDSSDVMIENIAPVISSPKITGENRYENANKEVWYSGDVEVSYEVSDKDSGLSEVKFSRTHEKTNSTVENNHDYYDKDVMTNSDEPYTLSTDPETDGKCNFKITVKDNAGNSNNDEKTVYKDTTKPYISGFDFNRMNSNILSFSSLNIVGKMSEKFSHFFDNSSVMTVAARDDQGASSGIQSISCVLYNSDGSKFIEYVSENPSFDNGVYTADFLIPEGFKGDIRAWATDNVKNKSDEQSPDGFAAENQQRHNSTSSLTIDMPQTEYSDVDNLPLYSDNVTALVTVEDAFSGIKTIEWLTSDFEGWRSITIDDNGNIYGDSDGWNVERRERNIALTVSNSITVSNDANGNFIRLKVTDNSGNVSEDETHFSIDKQIPVISVSGIQSSPETKYYNSNKTAHIVITERNFNAPLINGTADGGFEEDANSVRNTDGFRHFKDIVYDKDGEYYLDIENTDLAGNQAVKYSSGKFIIDKTDPVLKVEFSKKSGGKAEPDKNEYIDDVIKASVSVDEVNFDSGRIKITINGKEYTPEKWEDNNGKHITEIPYDEFKKDGEYTVIVSGTDLASNSFKTYSASFVIDTESPEIEFSGFDSANKGDVAPVINISDKNLDEYKLEVYRNGKLCEMSYDSAKDAYNFVVSDNGDYITGKWSEKTVGGEIKKEFVFDNFTSDECFDGSYMISVSALDKAENVLNETRTFSVNRFGSVFTVENLEKINGKYLNKAPDIVITETNVDKHQEGSDVIVILDKGSATEQLDETMYDISEPELLDDKSGYKYEYVIKAANFNQDLDYRISIQSVDEAGNKNVSTSRGAEIGFSVDTHDPEFKCDELVERAEFRESEKSFRINVNEKLSHITVTTNLDEVLLDIDADDDKDRNDNSYTFVMPASNMSRSVTVELTDLAGNKTVETYNNLLVTENIILYLFHKTWIKVAGGIALLGIGTASGFTIAGKRKRRRR